MNQESNENQPIEESQEENYESKNAQDNLGESGQDEIPEKAKLNKGIEQKAENNPGDVFQQIIESGNNNTQQQSKNQQVSGNGNAEKENRTNKQVTDGNNNNQNYVEVVVKNIFGENKDGKKYSFANRDNDIQSNNKNNTQSDANQEVTDPTKPLPPKSKSLPDVIVNDLSDYSKKLQEDYLVVVTCSDSTSALSVAYSLTEEISVSNKRLFTG